MKVVYRSRDTLSVLGPVWFENPSGTIIRVPSAGNVTVIARNLPRNLRSGKIEKVRVIYVMGVLAHHSDRRRM